MKFFISYRYTGEDLSELNDYMRRLHDILEGRGNEVYSTLFDEELPKETKKLFNHSYKKLENSDVILVLLKSNDKSEGMLMEIGYAVAKGKKVILAIDKNVENTYLGDLLDNVIEYDGMEDLFEKLAEVDL